jgi:hypothetical protein
MGFKDITGSQVDETCSECEQLSQKLQKSASLHGFVRDSR